MPTIRWKPVAAILLIGGMLLSCAAPPSASPFSSPQQPASKMTMPATNEQLSPLPTPGATAERQNGSVTQTPTVTAAPGAARPTTQDRAVADLSGRLGITPASITVREVTEVDWPDASLGCPQPGMVYIQVITPGQRIVLEANRQTYEYHAGRGRVILCSPHP